MLAIPLFLCLLMGPHGKWVKRFLPNPVNRIAFISIIVVLIAAPFVEGANLLHRGETFGGYFYISQAILCGATLMRFPYIWWFKAQTKTVA